MDLAEVAKVAGAVIGAVTGVTALAWRVIDEFGSFLRVAVSLEAPTSGWVTALTTVENKGFRPKTIRRTFLLVGPDSEGPLETAKELLASVGVTLPLDFTKDICALVPEKPIYGAGRALIPLSFYYSENVDIADETLTYRSAINLSTFSPETPYAVRFFLFAEGRLHRSTQDLFIIEPEAEAKAALI